MKRTWKWLAVLGLCVGTVSVYWIARPYAAAEDAADEQVEVVADESDIFESADEIEDIDENIDEMTNYVDSVQEMMTDPHDVISLAITEIQDICMATATMEKFPGLIDDLFKECRHLGARNSANVAVAECYITLGDYDNALARYQQLIKDNLSALNEAGR
jgi:hypothetical protein